jgi:hypothetical protein
MILRNALQAMRLSYIVLFWCSATEFLDNYDAIVCIDGFETGTFVEQ